MMSTSQTRRSFFAVLAGMLAGATDMASARSATRIEVWKDPSCGCCGDWVKYLEAHGFAVMVQDRGNNAVRARLGIDRKYGSCHAGIVEGYAIEGHVPVPDILRLLRERPAAIGLAVPGMKVGTPGMDGPVYQGKHAVRRRREPRYCTASLGDILRPGGINHESRRNARVVFADGTLRGLRHH